MSLTMSKDPTIRSYEPSLHIKEAPHSVPMKESSLIAIFGEKVGKPQQLHERPKSRTLATQQKKNWAQVTPPRFLSVLNYRIQMRVGHGRFPTWADHSKVRLVTDGGLNGPEKPRQKPHGIDVFNSEDKICDSHPTYPCIFT